MLRERVLVYGTLRRGGSNHELLEHARRLGTHVTGPSYRMLDLGPYPGVVPGGETPIHGEVYAVTPVEFQLLDALEDYPRSYTRERIATPWGPAWIYLYRPRGQRWPEIPSGDWFHHVGLQRTWPARAR